MIVVSITAELISAVYLFIIIVGAYYITSEETAVTKSYNCCCWLCLAGLIIDSVSYIMIGRVNNEFLFSLVTFFAFVGLDVLIVAYMWYLTTIVEEKNGKYSRHVLYIVSLLCTMDASFMLVGFFTGKLVRIENAEVLYGPWYDYVSVVPTICLLIYLIFLISNRRELGRRDLIILGAYVVLQAMNAVMWLCNFTVISGYVGFALALMIIFVLLQFRTISDKTLQAEIYNALSARDVLTGLNNRRSYKERLDSVPPDAGISAVFCDINLLKNVNDTLGHEAGDRLINRMADVMRGVFEEDDIFRISGDEFVVILQDEDAKIAAGQFKELKQAIQDNDRIAAIGYAEGKGGNILQVIKEAEQMMYSDKAAYYRETGRDRRS